MHVSDCMCLFRRNWTKLVSGHFFSYHSEINLLDLWRNRGLGFLSSCLDCRMLSFLVWIVPEALGLKMRRNASTWIIYGYTQTHSVLTYSLLLHNASILFCWRIICIALVFMGSLLWIQASYTTWHTTFSSFGEGFTENCIESDWDS